MRARFRLSAVLVGVLSLSVTAAFAADPDKSQDKKPKPKPVNAVCPVSDEAVDPNVTVTHNKKLVGFCCEDCVATFKKSPDKFMKKVEAEEAKNKKEAAKKGEQPAAKKETPKNTEPVNKFCPIDRENAVDPTVTTVHKGKVVGFCCEDCVKKFDLDPDTYVANLK
jgi:YHS domain-containing protein